MTNARVYTPQHHNPIFHNCLHIHPHKNTINKKGLARSTVSLLSTQHQNRLVTLLSHVLQQLKTWEGTIKSC